MLRVRKMKPFPWPKTTQVDFSLPVRCSWSAYGFLPRGDSGTQAPSFSWTCHSLWPQSPLHPNCRGKRSWRKPTHFLNTPSQKRQIHPIHIPLARVNHMATPGYRKARTRNPLSCQDSNNSPKHKLLVSSQLPMCMQVRTLLYYFAYFPHSDVSSIRAGICLCSLQNPRLVVMPELKVGGVAQVERSEKGHPRGGWHVKRQEV